MITNQLLYRLSYTSALEAFAISAVYQPYKSNVLEIRFFAKYRIPSDLAHENVIYAKYNAKHVIDNQQNDQQ